jgi:hypothetical protein
MDKPNSHPENPAKNRRELLQDARARTYPDGTGRGDLEVCHSHLSRLNGTMARLPAHHQARLEKTGFQNHRCTAQENQISVARLIECLRQPQSQPESQSW